MNNRDGDDFSCLVRGAVAGALGGPLLLAGVALSEKLRLGYVIYGGGLEIAALPYSVLFGAVFGSVVASIFWLLARKAIYPTWVVRAIIGAAIPLVFITFVNSFRNGVSSGLNPPTLIEAITNVVLYVVCFGTLPGIAGYSKAQRTKSTADDAT